MAAGKELRLQEYFARLGRCALAFSGGADSSYLLYAARKFGADVRAYYVKSAFQPRFEFEGAATFAASLGAELTIVVFDVLAVPCAAENTAERCYVCKSAMFGALRERASADGRKVLLDGTNASDRTEERPGMRAIAELSVLSPLRECGIAKDDVRRLSREAGLPTWNLPSYSCLAARIQTGERISAESLNNIEGAEDALRRLGFADFRVRLWNGAARLQFVKDDAERVLRERDEILRCVKPHFETVLLDMEWRVSRG